MRTDRDIAEVRNPNEVFYNLDSRRAYYDSGEGFLYFADSQGTLSDIINRSLEGLQSRPLVEQVYLDPHQYFTGAQRIRLDTEQAKTLLVALRLAGIRTTMR
jgi:hypothetical protein